jgi:hypothetical protein
LFSTYHADQLVVATDQRHRQDRAGPVARLPVELPIEAGVGVDVRDVLDGARPRHVTGDALAHR